MKLYDASDGIGRHKSIGDKIKSSNRRIDERKEAWSKENQAKARDELKRKQG